MLCVLCSGLWSTQHMHSDTIVKHVRHEPRSSSPSLSLIDVRPVKPSGPTQGSPVWHSGQFPKQLWTSLPTVWPQAHCATGNLQLDVMGIFLSVPKHHCDTDTTYFYSKWESTECDCSCQVVCVSPSDVFCDCYTQLQHRLISISWSGFSYLACT